MDLETRRFIRDFFRHVRDHGPPPKPDQPWGAGMSDKANLLWVFLFYMGQALGGTPRLTQRELAQTFNCSEPELDALLEELYATGAFSSKPLSADSVLMGPVYRREPPPRGVGHA